MRSGITIPASPSLNHIAHAAPGRYRNIHALIIQGRRVARWQTLSCGLEAIAAQHSPQRPYNGQIANGSHPQADLWPSDPALGVPPSGGSPEAPSSGFVILCLTTPVSDLDLVYILRADSLFPILVQPTLTFALRAPTEVSPACIRVGTLLCVSDSLGLANPDVPVPKRTRFVVLSL